MFAVLAGFDPRDPVSADRPLENFLPTLDDGVKGLRIGIPSHFYFEDIDPAVEKAVRGAADILKDLGAELVPVTVPGAESAHTAATVMIFGDVVAFHDERLASDPGKFDKAVHDRMTTARSYTALDYARALRAREAFMSTMRAVFAQCDVMLTPTIPMPVPPIDDGRSLLNATKAVTRFTYAGALAQLPGLSVPCGFTDDGMPVGLQLEAAWWQEPLLLRVGQAFQSVTDWHEKRPAIPG
jgi:aspartyl-tRNA(Asn)/glutamyl-tRNA(Gln) amidotransferase subunit A